MGTTLESMTKKNTEASAEQIAAAELLRSWCGVGEELVRLAQDRGLELAGLDGLVKLFTKNVLEAALNKEMIEHFGHAKNRAGPDRVAGSVRHGTCSKSVLSEATGQELPVEVSRDREGSFEPVIVPKRQRRLNGVEKIVLSLHANALTTGEISAHFG